MPIEVFWEDPEKTILHSIFTSYWTWEEFSNSVAQIIKLTAGIEHRVDQIIDLRTSEAIPSGPAVTYIKRSRSITRLKRRGITVLVGANPIIQGLIAALQMSEEDSPTRLFAPSLELALELIKQDREQETNSASNP